MSSKNYLFGLVLFFLIACSSLLNDDKIFLTCLLAGVIYSYIALVSYLRKQNKFYLSFIIFIFRILYELVFLFLYTLISNDHIVFNNVYKLDYSKYSFEIVLSSIIPLLSIFFLSFFLSQTKGHDVLKANNRISTTHHYITLFVIGFSFLTVFSDAFFDIPFLSYIARVGHAAFILFAFWIGYWNKKLGLLWPVSLIIILIEVAFTILSGGRFNAFLLLGLLYFGYLFSLEPKQRKIGIYLAIGIAPIVIYISALLGFVRDTIGRGDFELVNADRIELFRRSLENIEQKKEVSQDKALLFGIGRNIKWPNLSVIILSPEKIPFRGLDGIEKEFASIFSVVGFSSGFSVEEVRSAREKIIAEGLDTGMANKYGYYVTRLNSVEWSLLADAWSRGGSLAYALYFVLALSILIFIENRLLRKLKNPAERALILIVFIHIIWSKTGAVPMYMFIRTLILDLIFSIVILRVIRVLPRFS